MATQNIQYVNTQYIPSELISAIYQFTGIQLSYQWTSSQGLALQMICGYFLGFMMCLGISSLFIISKYNESYIFPFILYIIFSSLFYTLEYIWSSLYHPNTLNVSAFILFNHSKAFYFALIGCFTEYFIECIFFGKLKLFGFWHFCGLLMVIIGQIMRSLAQFTAGSNFTHLVATERRNEHQLITNGIYSYSRHPSYAGYFYWAIGTQILLGNPLCSIGYTIITWRFFNERIEYEEYFLRQFFKDKYNNYKQNTCVGIPFIK